MFHLIYRLDEAGREAGYLCVEEQTYKLVAFNKTDVIRLARNNLISGCHVREGDIQPYSSRTSLDDVKQRVIRLEEIKDYVRFRNGICNVTICGARVKNGTVMVRLIMQTSSCADSHESIRAVYMMRPAIMQSGGSVSMQQTQMRDRMIAISCDTSQFTGILTADACRVTYKEPNLIMRSEAPAEWKKKCSDWLKTYIANVENTMAEAKRSPYGKLVSPAIILKRFPDYGNNLQGIIEGLTSYEYGRQLMESRVMAESYY